MGISGLVGAGHEIVIIDGLTGCFLQCPKNHRRMSSVFAKRMLSTSDWTIMDSAVLRIYLKQ
jgi:hypothetical protein